MTTTIQTAILKRIKRKDPAGVYTPKDFLDLGSRDAVDQGLSRLVRQGDLVRLGRGLYHAPRINPRLGVAVPPDTDKIADALGRQTGSRVAPSGAASANRFGLSTQVPAKAVYLTDGRTRTVKVGSRTITLKHVAAKRFPDRDDLAGAALQAMQHVGPDGLDDSVIDIVRHRLAPKDRTRLVKQARYADGWVMDAARQIAAGRKAKTHG